MSEQAATQRFAELVEQRPAIGVEKHAPAYLDGPCLLEPIALEAIDAFNYAQMEARRLRDQFPPAADAHRAVDALVVCCDGFAHAAARGLARSGGQVLDVEAVAYERCNGPAAAEYGYFNFLYRDNFAEITEEYADAVILAGFEIDRRAHQGITSPQPADNELRALARLATSLAEAALAVADDVLPSYPPPARAAAYAA